MDVLTNLQTFRLTLKECQFRDLVVQAPDLESALDIAYERWTGAQLDQAVGGYVVVLDENDQELDELVNW